MILDTLSTPNAQLADATRPQPRDPRPASDTGRRRSPAVARPHAAHRRETAPGYGDVIAVVSPGCRVINCRDDLQWIVQRRRGERCANVSFHRDRESLIERSGAWGNALRILRELPEWHP